MVGYVTLLEGWIYDHFRPLESHRNMEYRDEQPHVQCWTPRNERGPLGDKLRSLRETIDAWMIHEVLLIIF